MTTAAGLADFTRLAAHVCETQVAALTLTDGQRLEVKAAFGLPAEDTGLALALAERAMARRDLMVVRDLQEELPQEAGPHQREPRRLRFFAGLPLVSAARETLGVLVLLDPTPRPLLPRQREALQQLARLALHLLAHEREHRQLEATFTNAPLGITMVDQENRLVRANPAFCDLVGRPLQDLLGHQLVEITHAEDVERDRDSAARSKRGESVRSRVEKRLLHRNGDAIWVAVTAAPLDAGERAPLSLLIVEDITERRRDRLERERLALTDTLTGVANRRAGEQALARELARAERMKTPLSVALIDVDNLKVVNDNLGHAAGDRTLRAIAVALESTVRRSDLVIRWAGDEFLVLLGGSELQPALRLAERACEIVGQLSLPGLPRLSISAGCAQWQTGERAIDLVARADQRLYLAKEAGRDAAR